jgi:hypothetical protein
MGEAANAAQATLAASNQAVVVNAAVATPLPAMWMPRWPISGTLLLAWRNLTHERTRFAATLIGVVFSVALMGIQLGLLIGFARGIGSSTALFGESGG